MMSSSIPASNSRRGTITAGKKDKFQETWNVLIENSIIKKNAIHIKRKDFLNLDDKTGEGMISKAMVQNGQHLKCSGVKKCKADLFCLAFLQSKDWKLEDVEEEEDPTMKKSDKVGIKNLGATCYLNTLLQIWFYNQSVRRIIYSYQPQPNQTQNVLMLLQSLFAQMQSSKAPWIDARPLVDMLDLRSHIQQDSLEFSKLLGSLLEAVLSASPHNRSNSQGASSSLSLSTKFAEEFKGFFRYTTTCCHCNSNTYRETEFAELEVSIPSNGSLLEAIGDVLSHEKMSGANQYQCGNCNTLRDAIRSTQLKIIPPTLQIIVNRFVFDVKTLTKKKSNKTIAFPASINMSRYTSSTSKKTAREDNWYDLSAVLLHRGTSANSGHYICRVFDQEKKQWLNCDDETVSILYPPNFQLKDFLDGGGGPATATSKKGNVDDSDVMEIDPPSASSSIVADPVTLNDFKSKAAYQLCYTARSSVRSYPDVPERILESVAHKNAIEEQDIAEQEKKEELKSERIAALRKEFEDLYSCWQKNPNDLKNTRDLVFIPAESFSKAIKRVTSGLYEDAEDDLVEPNSVNIDYGDLLCTHNKLNLSTLGQVKVITERGFDRLVEMGFKFDHKLTPLEWCKECFKDTLENLVETQLHSLDLALVFKARQSRDKFGVSKKWFQEWRKKVPFTDGNVPNPDSEPYRSDVYCEHGGVATDNSKIQFVSKEVYQILQARYGYKGPEEDSDRCAVCITVDQENTLGDYEQQEKKESVSDLKRLLIGKQIDPDAGCTYYLVPKSFLDKWKLFVKSKSIMQFPVLETNSLICGHGKIMCQLPGSITGNITRKASNDCVLVDDDEWSVLVRLYGEVETPLQVSTNAIIDRSVSDGDWKVVHGRLVASDSPRRRQDMTFHFTPEFCAECKESEELNYKSATIFVVKRSPPDTPAPKGTDSSDVVEIADDNVVSGQKRSKEDFFRSQKRSRNGSKVHKKRERAQLSVNPDLTVRALKESASDHLVSKFQVPPIYQKLFFNENEVFDDQTMRQLKIKAGAEMEIEIFDQDAYDFNDDGEGAVEYGFTGTKLSGAIPIGKIWECSVCTLLNDAHLNQCAACDTGRP